METRDYIGRTPIIYTAVSGNREIVGWLLRYSAFRGAKDTVGLTAASIAVEEGYNKITKLLEC